MAPSEIPKEAGIGGATSNSRYLTSSSVSPSSAPSSSSSSSSSSSKNNTKRHQKGANDVVGGGGVGGIGGGNKEIPMADSPRYSEEEMYFSSHHGNPHDDISHDDNSHEEGEDHHEQGETGEVESHEEKKQQQKHQRQRHHSKWARSSTGYSDDSYNGSSIKTVPEVKYAKAGILPPSNVIINRSGGVGGGLENNGDIGQILPGETLYLSQNPGDGPSGQYQKHPSYTSHGNGLNGNGNYNANGNGAYMPMPNNNNHPNGASSPQPNHPFNNVAGGVHHYPYIHYPPGGGPHYYDPHGQYVVSTNTTSGNGLNVRGEEVGIVLVVLLLWVGAIVLFFNRWGKIRMLEPYQPKFCETHRPSCPMAEVTAISNIPPFRERAFSKYNISTEMLAGPNGSPHFVKCNYHGVPSTDPTPGFSGLTTTTVLPGGLSIPGAGYPGGGSTGMLNNQRNSMMMNHHHQHHHHLRPRQNSVFVTSPSSQVSFYGSDFALKSSSRKTKSAVDLPTLVLTGDFIDNVRRNSKSSITQL